MNLMNSLLKKYGWNNIHSELRTLRASDLQKNRTILFLIDALWANSHWFVDEKYKKYFQHQVVTSSYPCSTTSAVTAVQTWLTPLNHGLLSRSQYMKAFNFVGKPLPYLKEKEAIENITWQSEYFSDFASWYARMNVKSWFCIRQQYVNSAYTSKVASWATQYGFWWLDDMPATVRKAIDKDNSFIYCYIEDYDSTSHKHGYNSYEAIQVLNDLFRRITNMIDSWMLDNFNILITWDHGQTLVNSYVYLDDFLELHTMLRFKELPWDGRHRYIHLQDWKKETFLKYFEAYMSEYFYLYSRQEILENGLYGNWEISDEFEASFWDYVIIAKWSAEICDDKQDDHKLWEHGWLSEDEMLVSLYSRL